MYKDAGGAGDIFLRHRQACQKAAENITGPAGLLRRLNCSLSMLLRDCTYLLQLSLGGGGNTFRRCTE